MPLSIIREFLKNSGLNTVSEQNALRPEYVGMPLFDDPVFGVADAADPLWEKLREEGVVGPWHALPGDFLPGAKRVISFFLPYSEPVRRACRTCEGILCLEWVHGRIEGQECINALSAHLAERLGGAAPAVHPNFTWVNGTSSNWSERHAAYIAGVGTFSMSRGIITRRGMAGRLGSVILKEELPVTPRPYTGIYDWCILCGACARRCPVEAIDPKASEGEWKDNAVCNAHLQVVRKLATDYPSKNPKDRYGCGKCQAAVPCESRAPGAPKE